MEPQVIESFLARIEREIDARVDSRLERKTGRGASGSTAMAVPLASLGFAIPLTAIAGGIAGGAGMLLVWIGIVLVNFAYALSRRA